MSGPLSSEPAVGTPVELRFTKYDGSPHWEYDLIVLGTDAHGLWLGGRPGDVCRRIGRTIEPGVHWVTLVPAAGAWIATFNEPGGPLGAGTYVDLTDPPTWQAVQTARGAGLAAAVPGAESGRLAGRAPVTRCRSAGLHIWADRAHPAGLGLSRRPGGRRMDRRRRVSAGPGENTGVRQGATAVLVVAQDREELDVFDRRCRRSDRTG